MLHDNGTDSNWQVNGVIVVTNPNSDPVMQVNVTDSINDPNASCLVNAGSNTNLTVASGTTSYIYICTYSAAPATSSETNTVTVTWPIQPLSNGSLAGGSDSFSVSFSFGSPNLIDECVDVNDTNSAGPQNVQVCVGDSNPTTFTYSLTVAVPPFDCQFYPNTATFTTTDPGATDSASKTVEVCGPAHTGALTMGFWQNKNGQGIIATGASASGVCNSGNWLRQFNPFQNLSMTANCSAVATYVFNVIKGGGTNCAGTSCNAMLKAQMLATALDVYFSDPFLGGNRIGAPSPIGNKSIDLTMICFPILSGSSCGGFENDSGAFPSNIAGRETVSAMLIDASNAATPATTMNPLASPWYAQVKATQVMAKDAFDAINNQVAFAP